MTFCQMFVPLMSRRTSELALTAGLTFMSSDTAHIPPPPAGTVMTVPGTAMRLLGSYASLVKVMAGLVPAPTDWLALIPAPIVVRPARSPLSTHVLVAIFLSVATLYWARRLAVSGDGTSS